MRFFFAKKKPTGNTRRLAKVAYAVKSVKPVKKPSRWFKPMLEVLVASVALMVCGFGVLKLNETCSVTYWDIQADKNIKPQIEKYLSARTDLDFWHTRAIVLQDGLRSQVPDIQRLQISRVLPDGLLVQAVARQPMALWKDEASQEVMLIDEKGVAYRTLLPGETFDLPMLRVKENELSESVDMLLALQKYDEQKWMRLSEMIVAEQGWRLNFAKGEQWNITSNDWQDNLIKVIQILDMPRWANGNWKLDTRVPERWFIRPAKREVI
ncbi:MAG: hypothetical protein R8M14_08805 [Ghiorsea sp.]